MIVISLSSAKYMYQVIFHTILQDDIKKIVIIVLVYWD